MTSIAKLVAISIASAVIGGAALAETLRVEANTSIPIRLQDQASAVVLGNQNIADVSVHDGKLLFVTGKSFGTTNLMVFNKEGNKIFDSDIAVSVKEANQVAINRAGLNHTYDCAPDCREVLSAGDNTEYFENLLKQQLGMRELTE